MFWITLAIAASPYKDLTGDAVAVRTLDVPPEDVVAWLDSTERLEQLLPCTSDWTHTGPSGPAATTYGFKAFERRLTLRIAERGERYVDIDHEGKKGFVTRLEARSEPQGTVMTLTTFLNAPGWPFRKYFYEAVHPGWRQCNDDALTRLTLELTR